jgi:ferritin-like metal-binding protein YciE
MEDKESIEAMLSKLMDKLDQNFEQHRKETKQEFRHMGEQLINKMEQIQRKTKQDMQEIVENVCKERKIDSDNFHDEKHSEIVTQTNSKLSS